jgi:hypothetical protein
MPAWSLKRDKEAKKPCLQKSESRAFLFRLSYIFYFKSSKTIHDLNGLFLAGFAGVLVSIQGAWAESLPVRATNESTKIERVLLLFIRLTKGSR